MAKSNIHKKTKNYLSFLKILTRWLGNKKRDPEFIKNVIDKYDIDNNIMRRILMYVINTPHVQWYCNKYLNNKFDFNRYDTYDLLFSLVHIMDINKCNESKKFFFSKASDFKDTLRYPLKKLLKEYFETIHYRYYNDNELNFLYKLYMMGEINQKELIDIDILLNNKQSIKFPENQQESLITTASGNIETSDPYPNIPDNILQFMYNLQNKKLSECKNCPLYDRSMVVFDTNLEDFGELDILFIGLNPGRDEAQQGRPFIGPSGQEIRNIISKFPKSVKWGITNFIMCFTSNKTEIEKLAGSVEELQNNCNPFVREIFTNFPTKNIVAVGGDALARFNITQDKISQASGNLYKIADTVNLIPLIHPSSLIRSRNRYQGIFDKSSQNIINLFKNKIQTTNNNQKDISKNNNSIPNTSLSIIQESDITEDLTFFDSRELSNNKILLIYIDQKGQKKYIVKDYKFQFYVKNGNWNECSMINTNMDYVIEIDGIKKYQAAKYVREYLNDIKRS
ncbi:MAG: uracil-DNA glycosylase family protein [bacterium]